MISVNLNPINEFRYNQIHNHAFQYLLLDKDYSALHSPFECKDYLQDMFYAEYTGKGGEIYGMNWKQGMLDMNVEFFHLAIMWLQHDLKSRVPYIQEFLNHFEDALGISHSTVYETDNDGIIVIDFSKEWTENGPLFSAFTTCIRISGTYMGGDPIEYLKTLKAGNSAIYSKVDVGRMNIKRFNALIHGMRPVYDWNNFKSMMYVHNTGMVEFSDFPELEVS